jgi:hypothetical protein
MERHSLPQPPSVCLLHLFLCFTVAFLPHVAHPTMQRHPSKRRLHALQLAGSEVAVPPAAGGGDSRAPARRRPCRLAAKRQHLLPWHIVSIAFKLNCCRVLLQQRVASGPAAAKARQREGIQAGGPLSWAVGTVWLVGWLAGWT